MTYAATQPEQVARSSRKHFAVTRIATIGDQIVVSLTNFAFLLAMGRAFSAEEFASFGMGLSIGLMLQSLQRHAVTIPLMLKPDAVARRRRRAVLGEQFIIVTVALVAGANALALLILFGADRFVQLVTAASVVCLIVYLQLEFARAFFVKSGKPWLLLASAGWYACVSGGLALAALFGHLRYESVLLILAACMLLHAAALMLVAQRPSLRNGWRLCRIDLRRYGGWSAAAILTYSGYNHLPLLILGALAAPIHAAVFVATRSLLQPLQILLRGLDVADKSSFAAATRDPNEQGALRFTTKLMGLYALVGIAFGAACASFAEPLIGLAYGAKFSGFGTTLIAWVPAYIFLAMTMPMESLVYARGAFRGYFTIRGVASLFAVAACLPLIARYQDLGAVAACAGGWLIAAAGTFILLVRGTRP